MIVDLAAYRQKKIPARPVVASEDEELLCVNWAPAQIIAVERVRPVAPLASPALPESVNENLDAFETLAYTLATQI